VAQGGLETSFDEGGNISFSLHELHKLMNVDVNKKTSLASSPNFSLQEKGGKSCLPQMLQFLV
jgi:hypothetical protein